MYALKEPDDGLSIAPAPGIYPDISNADYHGGPGLSKSTLDWALKLGRLYEYYRIEANVQKETSALREGKILHKVVLEFEDFQSEYVVQPQPPEGSIPGDAKSLQEFIAAYNASLPEKPKADELIQLISSHNNILPQQIPMGANLAETETAYDRLPEAYKTIGPDEKKTATAMKACIRTYNATLPQPVRTSGAYSDLLDNLAGIGESSAEFVARIRQIADPLPLSGKKEELKARILLIKPDAVFADEWLDAWAQTQLDAGKEILSRAEYDHAIRIREAVFAHPEAAMLLGSGQPETSCYWDDPKTGELLKCRFDWLDEVNHVAPDLKFLRDVSPVAFARDGAAHNYHIQAAHYDDGFYQLTGHHISMPFICVEKDAPLGTDAYKPVLVAVHYWKEADLERALRLRDLALRQIIRWRETGYYPGYEGINEVSVPGYQVAREEALLASEPLNAAASPETDTFELPDSIF